MIKVNSRSLEIQRAVWCPFTYPERQPQQSQDVVQNLQQQLLEKDATLKQLQQELQEQAADIYRLQEINKGMFNTTVIQSFRATEER